jgi:hypothetical protein
MNSLSVANFKLANLLMRYKLFYAEKCFSFFVLIICEDFENEYFGRKPLKGL